LARSLRRENFSLWGDQLPGKAKSTADHAANRHHSSLVHYHHHRNYYRDRKIIVCWSCAECGQCGLDVRGRRFRRNHHTVPRIVGCSSARRECNPSVLAICVLGYFELQAFEWISARELSGRMSGIEWLPFAAYHVAHPQAVLFDLVTKLCLSAPVGFLFMAQRQSIDPEPGTLRAFCACSLLGCVWRRDI
jgi:hypothetical protein